MIFPFNYSEVLNAKSMYDKIKSEENPTIEVHCSQIMKLKIKPAGIN